MPILQIFAIIVVILTPSCRGTVNNCTQNPAVKCSMRYDLVSGNARSVFYNSSCQWWYSINPVCDSSLKIRYYNIPPYMISLPDGSVDGILPGLLNIVLKTCCNMCTRLTFLEPFSSIKEASAWFYNSSTYSIMMPVLVASQSDTFFNNPFVKLLDSPGVVYVTIDNSANDFMQKTLTSIGRTWPLFVITILLTVQGGVFIWLLDQRENPDEFPRSFIRGTIEGSWWAYISMTTVGYGDKAPRSILGRIFAIFWITVGIAISSMFTASLSSSLTSAATPEKTSLEGLKVGYLWHAAMAYEDNIIYREGAIPKQFYKVQDMIEALRRNEIKGILMDSLILRFHWNELKNSGLKLTRKTDIKNSETDIGLTFSSSAFKNWGTFMSSFLNGNKDATSRLLREAVNTMKVEFSLTSMKLQEAENLDPNKVYHYIMIICGTSGVVVLCIGFGFTIIRKFWFAKKMQEVQNVHEMEVQKDGTDVLDNKINQVSGKIGAQKGGISNF